jgi:hypothetical protein
MIFLRPGFAAAPRALEVRAKTDKTPAGDRLAEDCLARNYGAMFHGKKGFE